MQLKIKIVNKSGYALPEYKSTIASGCDLRACIKDPVLLGPNMVKTFPTGLYIAIPAGYEGQVRPRSGLSAQPGVPAAFGTIDADYRGELKVTLYNHSKVDFLIEPGMRIAQLCIAPIYQAVWDEVDALDETERGSNGHGSTGLK